MPNHLSENGIGGTSTLKANRTDNCPIKDLKVISKEDPRSSNYRYDSKNKIIVVRWNENSVDTLASNYQPVNPVGTNKRCSRKEKKKGDVLEPSLMRYYNKMGEVDRMDQNISYYRIAVRSKN